MQETVNQENETVNQGAENQQGTESQQGATTEKTFTQDEVNKIINKRFAEYKTLQEKAKKLDEIEEASKSELQKATEKVTELQNELNGLKKEREVLGIRSAVANTAGIPVELLTGETQEDCEKQAKALLEFAGKKLYPNVRDSGELTGNIKRTTAQQFVDWFNQLNK